MKSRVLFLLALLASSLSMSAQNLVPNGSFEEGSECPMFLDDLHFRCDNWYKSIQVPGVPMNENPSPDWYHACSEFDALSTPNFVFGYQEPFDGLGLAAITCFNKDNPEYREIMGVELTQPLEIGVTYTISFKIVGELESISTGIVANRIGFKLTTLPLFYSFETAVNNFAHGSLEDMVEDTLNWTSASFEFTSDSSYTHLHIGSFFTNEQMDTLTLGTNFPRSAHYFIDDVTLLPSTLSSVDNANSENKLKIYPNPTRDYITIENYDLLEIHNQTYTILSTSGSLVQKAVLSVPNIYSGDLKSGLYFLRIEIDNGNFYFQKFIKR